MTADELVEKVARTMCAAMQPMTDPDKLQPMPRGMSGMRPHWRLYEAGARAAIRAVHEAMREPSEEMLKAGHHEQDQCAIHNYGGSPTVEDVWAVMLAAHPIAEAARDE